MTTRKTTDTSDKAKQNGHRANTEEGTPQPTATLEWQRYFDTLFSGLPTGGWAHAWRLEGRRTIWVQSVNDAMKAIETLGDKDIYASIGIAAKEGGPYDRLKKKTAIGYLGVLADLDIFWPGHKEIGKDGKPYPPDAEAVMAFLDTLPLRPTTVVATGHGVQATWLYEEMQPYNWEERNFLPRQVSLAWEKYLNARAAEQGWTAFDSVADVPRVMRVPSTVNFKDAEHPVETRLIAITEARYTPQDFLDAMGVAADDLPSMTEEEAEANGPVDDGQRFTESHPCPICDGHKDMPQGEGIRCWGFLSRDGTKVFCTREEFGGVEIETDVGTVYMHERIDDDPANAYDDSDGEDDKPKAKAKATGAKKKDPHIKRLTVAADEAFAKPGAELFNTELGDLYARVPVGGHYETMLVRSRAMRLYLGLVYLAKYQTPCSRDALNQYIEILEGQALYQSDTRPVFTRIARVSPECIYVDLGTPDHRAVEITPDGWLIVDNPPVRFRRPRGFGALDIPVETDKSLEEALGPFIKRNTPKGWPGTPRGMSATIGSIIKQLGEIGIKVEFSTFGRKYTITDYRPDKTEEETEEQQSTRPQPYSHLIRLSARGEEQKQART